ncbi:hypothetical protein B0I35DRAFT_438806 [Stachybotrys elegans]|uniref:Zn(2)-C6 fungal-type domain-containing protein n=1 Tax=Stachybotrys elegans TaxID=80388 RepID=A0A8K0WPZ1_9HYPO|nr:hypothetical protein B0I35DRAFT_438806 [Stachybotrys elegans]
MASPFDLGQMMDQQLQDVPFQTDFSLILSDGLGVPYRSKRPHKKSRAGCKNCKARKVKCSEDQPACRSCRLRKEQCIYPTPDSLAATSSRSSKPSSKLATKRSSPMPGFHTFSSSDNGSSASSPSSSPAIIQEPSFTPAGLGDSEVKLMWFYSTVSCSSFSVLGFKARDQLAERVLKGAVVQHAFQHPFLMDTIFALTSLHMECLGVGGSKRQALAYRDRSYHGYRQAIEKADPKSYPALLANSLLLTCAASEAFRDPEAPDLYILDWMMVWRGIGAMLIMSTGLPDGRGVHSVIDGSVQPLFTRAVVDWEEAILGIPSHLLAMVTSIPPDDPDYLEMDTYMQALACLGMLYQRLTPDFGGVMNLRIITWLTFLSRPFIPLALQKRPRALIILAHYAVFCKLINGGWWTEGIGTRTINDICKHLGAEWYPYLTLPTMAIHADNIEKLCRLILNDPSWTQPLFDRSEEAVLVGGLYLPPNTKMPPDDMGGVCAEYPD